jgi:hypothetical protein
LLWKNITQIHVAENSHFWYILHRPPSNIFSEIRTWICLQYHIFNSDKSIPFNSTDFAGCNSLGKSAWLVNLEVTEDNVGDSDSALLDENG